jgi:hypothetical protein
MCIQEQIQRIKVKLPLAQKKDAGFKIFGASSHKYLLNPPISQEVLNAYEAKNNIVLPIEYKQFLTEIGNGGAGPYYGIYKLKEDAFDEYLSKPCHLHPILTDEQWASLTEFSEQDDIDDEEYEIARNSLFQGMLHIGTQGCTYQMMLIVSGENRGRVIH